MRRRAAAAEIWHFKIETLCRNAGLKRLALHANIDLARIERKPEYS